MMARERVVITPKDNQSTIPKIVITLNDLRASETKRLNQPEKIVIIVPELLCCYCSQPIYQQQSSGYCGVCKTPYHDACWRENGGCGVFQCDGVNNARRYRKRV